MVEVKIRKKTFKPIQNWGFTLISGEKLLMSAFNPTSYSPITYTNVGVSPQNFLTFSFNPFATLV